MVVLSGLVRLRISFRLIFRSSVPVPGALAGAATPAARHGSPVPADLYRASSPTFGANFPPALALSFLPSSTLLPRSRGCLLSACPVVVLNCGESVLSCYPEAFCEPVPSSVTVFAFFLGQDAIDLSGRVGPIIRRCNRACEEDRTASAAGLTRSLTPYLSVAAPAGPFSAPKVRAIPTGPQAEIVGQLVPDPVRHLVEVLLTVVVDLFLRDLAVLSQPRLPCPLPFVLVKHPFEAQHRALTSSQPAVTYDVPGRC